MEFCELGDLRKYFTPACLNTLSPVDLLDAMIQISKGVLDLHSNTDEKGISNPIVHRDIKKENVLVKLVQGKHVYVLCDFGLSKEIGPPQINKKHSIKVGA